MFCRKQQVHTMYCKLFKVEKFWKLVTAKVFLGIVTWDCHAAMEPWMFSSELKLVSQLLNFSTLNNLQYTVINHLVTNVHDINSDILYSILKHLEYKSAKPSGMQLSNYRQTTKSLNFAISLNVITGMLHGN